jgi:hypothetical protein
MLSSRVVAPQAYADLIRRYPGDRDDILRALNQTLGAGFALSVVTVLRSQAAAPVPNGGATGTPVAPESPHVAPGPASTGSAPTQAPATVGAGIPSPALADNPRPNADAKPPAAAPAPAPAPAPTAAPTHEEPASRHATWKQVSQAAEDPKAQADLDIAWIDSLPDPIKNSIDVDFADDTAKAAIAGGVRSKLAKIDTDINKQEAKLGKETKARLKADHLPTTAAAMAKDQQYADAHQQLEAERAQEKVGAQEQATHDHDDAMAMKQPDQSVARPDAPTVKRLEGKALARTNFMSWAVDVLGSTEAAKAHFLGIKAVKGHGDLYLAAAARARFEAAQADFEATHPGYTFVDTSVGEQLRGMHQGRWGVGMLGHALGEAFDFKAYDNPNVKIDRTHSYAYLIQKFGGVDGKRGTGRATTSIAESAVEKTGKETVAGTASADGVAMIAEVHKQFEEMVQTSARLKASMAPQLPKLQEARDLYFELPKMHAELAKANNDLKHADSVAKQQISKMKFDDPAEQKAAIDQIKANIAEEARKNQETVDQAEATINQNLKEAFAAWSAGIQADVDADQGKLDASETSRASMTAIEKQLDAIDAAEDGAMSKLDQFASDQKLTTLAKFRHPPKDAKTYKKQLALELKKGNDGTRSRTKKGDAGVHSDMAALQYYQQKLGDRAFVFGHGEKQKDGHWGTRYEAESVAVMQLLENGTVRSDAMPAVAETSGARKGVYNGDVVATLAKFGWAPGANYGDTMHFDFIEGYNKAVPGGRSQANMQPTRYSPEGDLPEQAPAHKDDSKK